MDRLHRHHGELRTAELTFLLHSYGIWTPSVTWTWWRKLKMIILLARNQRANYYCVRPQSSRTLFECSLWMFGKTLDLAQHFGMFFFFRPYFAAAIASARWRCATIRCQMAEVKSVTRKIDFFYAGPRHHQSHNSRLKTDVCLSLKVTARNLVPSEISWQTEFDFSVSFAPLSTVIEIKFNQKLQLMATRRCVETWEAPIFTV